MPNDQNQNPSWGPTWLMSGLSAAAQGSPLISNMLSTTIPGNVLFNQERGAGVIQNTYTSDMGAQASLASLTGSPTDPPASPTNYALSSSLGELTPPKKMSFEEKYKNNVFVKNRDTLNSVAGAVSEIGSLLPGSQNTYNGPKGNIRAAIDKGYGAIAEGLSKTGPLGQSISTGMQIANAANILQGAIFGATSGMCVCAGTKVTTANGEIVNIEDLKQEQGILGWNENSREIRPQIISLMLDPSKKVCLEIKLESGQFLKCSIDHPILIYNHKFVRADQLNIGDNVGLSSGDSSKIIEIIPIGLQTVYNIQTYPDHTYIANGIITHNTTIDAIMDSPIGFLTGLGWMNQAFGKKSETITKDEEAFAQTGSSYGGTNAYVDNALNYSGKKYGLFSNSARQDANALMAEGRRQQNLVSDIGQEAADRQSLATSMSSIMSNARAFDMQGGYKQNGVRVGRYGMVFQELVNTHTNISKYQNGSQIPIIIQNDTQTPSRTLEELIDYAKKVNPRFIQRLSEPPKSITFIDDQGNKAVGSHYIEWGEDDNGNAIIYPRIQEVNGELMFFDNSEDAYNRALATKNYLITTPQEAEIFSKGYKSGWPKFFNKSQNGGLLPQEVLLREIKVIPKTSYLKEIEIPLKFKSGGQFNIIPDGALHARKHNMDIEGITTKGIPVVSQTKEGEIQQQAEIEKEEIIYRLEVTKDLERLYKIFYNPESSQKEKDDAALQAGKLLVQETLFNTQDNVGLLNK